MSARQPSLSPPPRYYAHSSRKSYLIPSIIRNQIQLLIENNNSKEASDLLLELTEVYAPKRVNEVIVIRRGFADIEKAAVINTLDFEIVLRERNRHALAILELADQLCGY